MVKNILLLILLLLLSTGLWAQYLYEASPEYPFGRPNPAAPEQVKDFAPMIGICDCKSVSRNQDQSWADTVDMAWRFRYIMNGMAVQDETLKADNQHSGSIRQYNADSARWYVHYYSSNFASPTLSSWEGNVREDGKIMPYRDQVAPNGMEGWFRLTFYNMSPKGFNWIGEWVDKAEQIVYPTWKIYCTKRN